MLSPIDTQPVVVLPVRLSVAQRWMWVHGLFVRGPAMAPLLGAIQFNFEWFFALLCGIAVLDNGVCYPLFTHENNLLPLKKYPLVLLWS